jgi:hypothetical protein
LEPNPLLKYFGTPNFGLLGSNYIVITDLQDTTWICTPRTRKQRSLISGKNRYAPTTTIVKLVLAQEYPRSIFCCDTKLIRNLA